MAWVGKWVISGGGGVLAQGGVPGRGVIALGEGGGCGPRRGDGPGGDNGLGGCGPKPQGGNGLEGKVMTLGVVAWRG